MPYLMYLVWLSVLFFSWFKLQSLKKENSHKKVLFKGVDFTFFMITVTVKI